MLLRLKIPVVIFFALLFCAKVNAQQKMSYDGYYITQPDTNSPFKYYLRFYPDGTVITVTTAGKPENLARWFTKDYKDVAKGKFELKDSTITFFIRTDKGEINYTGTLSPDNRMTLTVKSAINKYEGKEEYYFFKMDGLK
jgi:predicted 3-demethylubiquinone-9 3-methyltransferase (glyoxalase superfamily)